MEKFIRVEPHFNILNECESIDFLEISNDDIFNVDGKSKLPAFKVGDSVICSIRKTKKFAEVQSRKRRESVMYYTVKFETGEVYEGITVNEFMPCYIEEQLSHKLNTQKLNRL